MLQSAAIVLAAILVVPLVERGVRHAGVRWPVEQSLLHQRVIFPHLAEVYDELPGEARAHPSREDAADYDRNINRSRQVFEEPTRGDPELRAWLTRELASVVWRKRWFAIVLDVLRMRPRTWRPACPSTCV